MPTENTSLKNTTTAGDSNTTTEMVIGKINTYQRIFLIVAGSLLAYSVLIAVASKTAGYSLVYTGGLAEGAVALADYQIVSTNLALTKKILNRFKNDDDSNGNSNGKKSRELKQKRNRTSKKAKNKRTDKQTTTDNSGVLFVSENNECGCCPTASAAAASAAAATSAAALVADVATAKAVAAAAQAEMCGCEYIIDSNYCSKNNCCSF